MEQTNHITEETRKFICLESFSSEGRYCNKGETYTAYPIEGGFKLVFENGDMNFTTELFGRVVETWSDVLLEVTKKMLSSRIKQLKKKEGRKYGI
ncbi:hypothetical protein NGC20_13085 [Enterococcus hirae]|uniref:hypothetical protein n=1 Tax=Enterococcus hirae TaxID=1354 RepID=UPI002DBBEE0E|nr:hypothetical protein [Enterococcus hirae]MEB7440919.1 hypothetical protein [Enterococcus hirae]